MTFPLDWTETPSDKRYGQPTYRRSDGMVVRYDYTEMVWSAFSSDAGQELYIWLRALYPRAVIDALDQQFPLETPQRIAQIAFTPHNQLYALTDAGRVYRLSNEAQTWEPIWLPALPAISQQ